MASPGEATAGRTLGSWTQRSLVCSFAFVDSVGLVFGVLLGAGQ